MSRASADWAVREEPNRPNLEALQGLSLLHPVEADEGLSNGVLFDVEGAPRDPLDKQRWPGWVKPVATSGIRLSRGPQLVNVHGALPVYGTADATLQVPPQRMCLSCSWICIQLWQSVAPDIEFPENLLNRRAHSCIRLCRLVRWSQQLS